MCYHSNKLTHWQDCTIYIEPQGVSSRCSRWAVMALCFCWYWEGRRPPCFGRRGAASSDLGGWWWRKRRGRGWSWLLYIALIDAALFVVPSPVLTDPCPWLVYWLIYRWTTFLLNSVQYKYQQPFGALCSFLVADFLLIFLVDLFIWVVCGFGNNVILLLLKIYS